MACDIVLLTLPWFCRGSAWGDGLPCRFHLPGPLPRLKHRAWILIEVILLRIAAGDGQISGANKARRESKDRVSGKYLDSSSRKALKGRSLALMATRRLAPSVPEEELAGSA